MKDKRAVYTDPDNGDKFYEWDDAFYFVKDSYLINSTIIVTVSDMKENKTSSKKYITRDKCEIALAEFIANKHSKTLTDND